jgi:acetate kinase
LGLRKFGFHGLSYQYVTTQTAKFLGLTIEELRLVACHLGTGGSSAAAIAGSYSLDTSMGYTPLPGLIMSTRSGDIDPSIILTLIERDGYTPEQVNRLLNKDSGLLGVSGFSSDLFEIVARAESGDRNAKLTVEMYVHRLKFYIGGYLAILGGCHALAFTDDIGQRCWQARAAACAGLEALGVVLDPAANRAADGRMLQEISAPASAIRVLVVPTDEERVIAEEGFKLFQ